MSKLSAWVHCRPSNIDKSIQKYVQQDAPLGFKVIYAIVLKFGHKKGYVGQSKAFASKRWNAHVHGVPGKPPSLIHRAIKKHGVDNFEVFILALVPVEDANRVETLFISQLGTVAPNGYNIEPEADGGPMSQATRDKLSVAGKRRFEDPELRKKHHLIARAQYEEEERNNPGNRKVRATMQYNQEEIDSPGHRKRRAETQWAKLTVTERQDQMIKQGRDVNWNPQQATSMISWRNCTENHKTWLQLNIAGHRTDEARRNHAAARIRVTASAKAARRKRLQASALPFEPTPSKREPGAAYYCKDGRIGICSNVAASNGLRINVVQPVKPPLFAAGD